MKKEVRTGGGGKCQRRDNPYAGGATRRAPVLAPIQIMVNHTRGIHSLSTKLVPVTFQSEPLVERSYQVFNVITLLQLLKLPSYRHSGIAQHLLTIFPVQLKAQRRYVKLVRLGTTF